MKIIYIAGLYHSGSTMIDRLLAGNENIIGLGEIFKTYNDGPEELCTCGEIPSKCLFWSKFQDHNLQRLDKFYSEILAHFEDTFGDSAILVDSSKCSPFRLRGDDISRFHGLDFWSSNENTELFVIHLTRDPRSWTASLVRRDKKYFEAGLTPRLRKFFQADFFRLLQWYISHKRITKYLQLKNIQNVRISYEQVCMDASVLNRKMQNS